MGPPLSDAELAQMYPHLSPQQRAEMERWHRGRIHALMQGQEAPAGAAPWPEHPPEG